jgi:hypothetical protein
MADIIGSKTLIPITVKFQLSKTGHLSQATFTIIAALSADHFN